MNNKEKNDLINKLSVFKYFERSYGKQNRRWFVQKIINSFDPDDSNEKIENKTVRILAQSKEIAEANRDFTIKINPLENLSLTKRLEEIPLKVKIIYDMIAFNHELLKPLLVGYLLFLAKRRYRSVLRMKIDVPMCFSYRDISQKYSLNERAINYWYPSESNDLVFRLKKQTNFIVADAITNLWHPNKRNILECETTKNCVLMDSLLEATDAEKLLGDLKSRDDDYLMICQSKNGGKDFLHDKSSNRLFSQDVMTDENIQIGDHVYLCNDQIYAGLLPLGFWRGEHSLLVDSKNRNLKNGMLFCGFGIAPQTLATFIKEHSDELNTSLDRAYRLGKVSLEYIKSNFTSIRSDKVQRKRAKIWFTGVELKKPLEVDVYLITYEYKYIDYSVSNYPEPPTKKTGNFFVLTYIPEGLSVYGGPVLPTFGLHEDLIEMGNDEYALCGNPFFQYNGPEGINFNPHFWQIVYRNQYNNNKTEFYSLFILIDAEHNIYQRPLIDKNNFPIFDPKDNPLVTQPTVLVDDKYWRHLKNIGAIP